MSQDLVILVVTKLMDNIIPIAVSALSGFLAMKYNSFIEVKKEQMKENHQVNQALDNIRVTDEMLEFINKKAEEGLQVAAEKAFQSWKDSSKEEMSGIEKKDVAVDYVVKAVSSIVKDTNIIENIPNVVEKVLVSNRGKLDEIYDNLKKNFVITNGFVPEHSRDPFITPSPETMNIRPE